VVEVVEDVVVAASELEVEVTPAAVASGVDVAAATAAAAAAAAAAAFDSDMAIARLAVTDVQRVVVGDERSPVTRNSVRR
jgi:hypothetical protein